MTARLRPGVEEALLEIAELFDPLNVGWVLMGSAARALHGFAVEPCDIDIEVPAAAMSAAAAALGMRPRPAADGRTASLRATGAVRGVEVDVSGGLEVRGPGGDLPTDDALLRVFASTVTVGSRPIAVGPLEEQLARAIVLGDTARLDRFAAEAPAQYRPNGLYLSLRLAAASAAR